MLLKIFTHCRRWNAWRKCNSNSKLHKLLVLLGLRKSPTFELFFLPEEFEEVQDKYYCKEENFDNYSVKFINEDCRN